MDHSKFIRSLINAEMVMPFFSDFFVDEVIKQWLQDNIWVEDPGSRCQWCKHLEEIQAGFSEEQCRQNVAGGGSCYRETLKNVFIPVLQNTLKGIYPSLESLDTIVHKEGPIWDGFYGASLLAIIGHELGGTYMRMARDKN